MLWAASCKCSHQQLKLLKVSKKVDKYLRNHLWNKLHFFWYLHPSTLCWQIVILQGILFSLRKVFVLVLSRDMTYLVSSKTKLDIISQVQVGSNKSFLMISNLLVCMQLSSRINALIFDLLIGNGSSWILWGLPGLENVVKRWGRPIGPNCFSVYFEASP